MSFPYYDTDLAPFYSRFWATFAHFDGIHYLRVATHGYADWGSQAFFPLYPLLINFFTRVVGDPLYSGVILSLLSLVLALIALRRLFPTRPQLFLLVLSFPTAFFFLTLYTESLFFALSLWFFVALREKHFWLAAILAGLASATRLVGAFLAISLLIELLPRTLTIVHRSFFFLLSLSGLLLYMFFLYRAVGDPLLFFHIQPVFGAGRSGGELILLPQVIYRYGKIFVTTSFQTFPFWRALLEFSLFSWAFSTLVLKFRKLPPSVTAYLALSLLLPSLTGTLSSLPRYILVLTPWLIPETRRGIWVYLVFCLPLAIICFIQFARGIFVS
ncbi:MAG: hypothetical protein V1487_00365 [bacterium]